ncbi:MAG: DUF1127 domain-containing protein [Roseovarius sp.]|nr:DUF1127 domain-containing protein [Roseovarius sp.]
MAFNTETRTARSSLALDISAGVHRLVQRLQDHINYRTTVRELSRLDDATLADLGIYRSSIQFEAHKAVYGA